MAFIPLLSKWFKLWNMNRHWLGCAYFYLELNVAVYRIGQITMLLWSSQYTLCLLLRVWFLIQHYGMEIIAKELQLEKGHQDVLRLYLAVYKSFVEVFLLKTCQSPISLTLLNSFNIKVPNKKAKLVSFLFC